MFVLPLAEMMSGSRPVRTATIAAFWMLAAALGLWHSCLQYMVAGGTQAARPTNPHVGADRYHKAQEQVQRHSAVGQTAETSGSADVDVGARVREVMQMSLPNFSEYEGTPVLACVIAVSALCVGALGHGHFKPRAQPMFAQNLQNVRVAIDHSIPHPFRVSISQRRTDENQKKMLAGMALTVPLIGAAFAGKEAGEQSEKIDSLDAVFEPQTAVAVV